MYPYLLREPFEISTYFTLEMLAFIVGILLAKNEAKKVGVDTVKIIDLSLAIFIGGMMGGKIFHVFFDGHFMDYVNMCVNPLIVEINAKYISGGCTTDAACSLANLGNVCNLENGKCYTQSCTAAFEIWRGGFVYYGGLITSILVTIVFTKIKKMNLLKILDIGAPTVAIGLAIGRMGCYFAGCCYGGVTNSFLGITFPAGSSAYIEHLKKYPELTEHLHHSLAVYPTQLFSVGANILIFLYLILFLRRKRQTYQGQLFMHLLFSYSAFRFIIEFFRADERGGAFGLSTSQWISIIVISITTVITLYIRKRYPMETNVDSSK